MKVPKEIEIAAKELIDSDGYSFKYLGKYKEQEAYMYCFPEDTLTGFPFVYLLGKDGKVEEIEGPEALYFTSHRSKISE